LKARRAAAGQDWKRAAARIAVERTALHFLIEAEADEDTGSAGRRGVSVDRIQPLIDMAEAIGIMRRLALRHQRGAFLVGRQNGFERRGSAGGRFLRDIAQARVARHFATALVRVELADHHFHQRRFARAVTADEAHAATRRQRGAGAVDNGAAAEAHGDVLQIQHGRPRSSCWGGCQGGLGFGRFRGVERELRMQAAVRRLAKP
jgi:hypothetical protein